MPLQSAISLLPSPLPYLVASFAFGAVEAVHDQLPAAEVQDKALEPVMMRSPLRQDHDKFDGKLQWPQTAYLSRKWKKYGRYGSLSPLLFLYAYYYFRSFLLRFVEVLKKAAIPAIVPCSLHK
jgi:hypothetical protein